MIHFFGMVLNMSIDDRRVGGYTGYLYDEIFTDLAENYSINIKGFMSWAKDVMTICLFKQIHFAFCPKLHFTTNRDMCHQHCYAINKLNNTEKHTFIHGIDLSLMRVVSHQDHV